MFLHVIAQALQQAGVFCEAFHQYLPCAIQRSFRVGHTRIFTLLGAESGSQVFGGFFFRLQRRVCKQRIGQCFQSRLTRNLRTGSAFYFVGKIQIFQMRLVCRMRYRIQQLRRHLVLGGYRRDDDRTARLQFAQIIQAFIEQSQLDVVKTAGGFLAIARDERDGRPFVQHLNSSSDLCGFCSEFNRESLFYGRQHGVGLKG